MNKRKHESEELPPNSRAKTLAASVPVSHARNSGSVQAQATVVDLGKRGVIATGICFLDHMIDQLTSHAQLGVTVRVALPEFGGWQNPKEDYAGGNFLTRPHDQDIFIASGAALGAALRALIDRDGRTKECSGVFCCPLDEAFAEARLCFSPKVVPQSNISLSPYGTWPKKGREWIGCYRCKNTSLFFKALAGELRARLEVTKVRGRNAHHIVESAFKSFARVFRACLDKLRHGGSHGLVGPAENRVKARLEGKAPAPKLPPPSQKASPTPLPSTPLPSSPLPSTPAPKATSPATLRSASSSRSTKETVISVHVCLDECPSPQSKIVTGVDLLDRIFTEFRAACGFRIDIMCDGDTHIDDHHSAEDVSITLGKCLCASLGSKAGLTRMGCAEGESNGARVRVVLDLSNRPHFESDLPLDDEYVGGNDASAPMIEGEELVCGRILSCEMFHHVLLSLSVEMRSTVHVQTRKDNGRSLDLALATARAFGKALAECVRVDPRRAGKVASSKGTLSV